MGLVIVGKNATRVTGDLQLTPAGRKTVIRSVTILKANAGDAMVIDEGTAGATTSNKLTIDADTGGVTVPLNLNVENGVFLDITGTTAIYIITWD